MAPRPRLHPALPTGYTLLRHSWRKPAMRVDEPVSVELFVVRVPRRKINSAWPRIATLIRDGKVGIAARAITPRAPTRDDAVYIEIVALAGRPGFRRLVGTGLVARHGGVLTSEGVVVRGYPSAAMTIFEPEEPEPEPEPEPAEAPVQRLQRRVRGRSSTEASVSDESTTTNVDDDEHLVGGVGKVLDVLDLFGEGEGEEREEEDREDVAMPPVDRRTLSVAGAPPRRSPPAVSDEMLERARRAVMGVCFSRRTYGGTIGIVLLRELAEVAGVVGAELAEFGAAVDALAREEVAAVEKTQLGYRLRPDRVLRSA